MAVQKLSQSSCDDVPEHRKEGLTKNKFTGGKRVIAGDFWSLWIQAAKGGLDNALSGIWGGPALATVGDTGMDLFGGFMSMPAAIGHLGQGAGAYAGNPNEKNMFKLWNDIGTSCGLALGSLTGGAGAPAGDRSKRDLLPFQPAKHVPQPFGPAAWV